MRRVQLLNKTLSAYFLKDIKKCISVMKYKFVKAHIILSSSIQKG